MTLKGICEGCGRPKSVVYLPAFGPLPAQMLCSACRARRRGDDRAAISALLAADEADGALGEERSP